MSIGTSLFLIALGAILNFAVTRKELGGVQLDTVGVILMIVGVIGLLLSLLYMSMWRDRRGGTVVRRERYVDREPY